MLLKGLRVGFSMVMAVGIQNTFVLKQGIVRSNSFLIASICSLIYTMLIIVGVYGFGRFLSQYKLLLLLFSWGGVLFVFCYALTAFYSAFRKNTLAAKEKTQIDNIKKTILKVIAVSFLNPLIYLETCVLIGGFSTQFLPEELPSFTLGTVIASFIWYFSLSFGARTLKPFFENPVAWKILDFIIGCIMITIAISFMNSIKMDF